MNSYQWVISIFLSLTVIPLGFIIKYFVFNVLNLGDGEEDLEEEEENEEGDDIKEGKDKKVTKVNM
jgi:hypothetical protein